MPHDKAGGPSEGWLHKIFGKREKKSDEEKKKAKGNRKRAMRGAMHGYKRSGGLMERIKEGASKAKGLAKKHNPGY